MRRLSLCSMLALFGLALVVGCETTPSTPAEKAALQDEAQATLQRMTATDPSLQDLLNRSYGYAIFPSVGEGGAIVGGAYGRGVVYEQGRFIGYADLSQASIGLQLGGQTYKELLVFQTRDALDRFRSNAVSFGADATAVALNAGAAASTQFRDGVAVFVEPTGGLMAGVAINGQRFTFVPANQAGAQPAAWQQQQPSQQQPMQQDWQQQRQFNQQQQMELDQPTTRGSGY